MQVDTHNGVTANNNIPGVVTVVTSLVVVVTSPVYVVVVELVVAIQSRKGTIYNIKALYSRGMVYLHVPTGYSRRTFIQKYRLMKLGNRSIH